MVWNPKANAVPECPPAAMSAHYAGLTTTCWDPPVFCQVRGDSRNQGWPTRDLSSLILYFPACLHHVRLHPAAVYLLPNSGPSSAADALADREVMHRVGGLFLGRSELRRHCPPGCRSRNRTHPPSTGPHWWWPPPCTGGRLCPSGPAAYRQTVYVLSHAVPALTWPPVAL